MPTSLPAPIPTALDHARAAWLAGAPGAWARYQTCLRQLDARLATTARVSLRRRPRRPGARA